MTPNFFIVGAPKCGTTAWVEYLSTHPDICFSSVKEPHYFCTDLSRFRWANTEAEYLSFFEGCSGASIIGEASVQYLASEEAASNIAAFAPDAKILIFLRDPVDFLKSYHNQLLLNLDEDIADFADAWRASADMQARKIPENCREPVFLNYRAMGRFAYQIARFRAHFPDSQIKTIDLNEWRRSPRATYLEVLNFLGLEDDRRTEFPVVNEAKTVASARLAEFTERPPKWALSLSRLSRRLLGWERLGVVELLRSANNRKGYASPASDAVDAEIVTFFESDQRELAEMRLQIEGTHV